jgi:hypothetical protein
MLFPRLQLAIARYLSVVNDREEGQSESLARDPE